jgi:hypothetical protein
MYIVKIINGNITTPIHNEKQKLKSGSVVKGINTIDSFSFTLLPDNDGFDLIRDFTTLVSVYNTNKKRYDFYGRVLYSNSAMDSNGLITKEVVCESYFGFLCDSQQPYVDTKNWTVTELLKHIVDRHNEQVEEYKRFKIGTVTVTDPNNNLYIGIQRENTWKTIQDKLIGQLGGEIRFRVESDGLYIDYLTEIGVHRSTEIKMSKNMKSITKEVDPSSFISRLIPLGCKLKENKTTTDDEGNETTEEVETEERLEITSVNNGKNYIDVENGVDVYGVHVGYAYWDEVTSPSVLLTKARNYLAENNRVQVKYSITALDLSLLGLDIDDFDVHNYHPIINPLLGINDTARITKKNIDVCNDVQSNFEIGDNFKTLSEIQQDQFQSLKDSIEKIKLDTSTLSGKVSVTQSSLNDLNTKVEGAIEGTYLYIMYSPYEDGHEMTTDPDENTMYMGTCTTSSTTRPTDHTKYTWVKVRGVDGEDGTPGLPGTNQYFHIKYSNDGINFTEPNGEVLGEWMGTCVNNTEDDPEDFDDYTWHRIKGEQGVPGHDGIGIDGTSSYFHVRYSEVANPTTKEQMTENPSKYIGTYVDHIEDDSDDPKDYKWVQLIGTDGIPGTDGKNGLTYYMHIKYSDDGGATFTDTNGETSGKYIGVYTDTTQADSTDVSKYTWSLLKGADGKDGQTTYTWIKYANSPNSGMSDNPEGKTYMGIAYNKTTKTESTTYSDYTWSLIKGADGSDGINGTNGTDGKTYYTWVKYADDANGTNMSNDPTNKKYIGIAYNKTTSTESNTASDYSWALFRGADGLDGQNQYFYVRFSANSNGNPMTDTPQSDTKYIGVCATTSATAPTSYSSYKWSQCKGDQGIPGEDGKDGKTQYWHIKYSDDGQTFTENNGETLGAWIGTYVDFNETDSLVFSDYTWKKFTEDVDDELEDIRNVIVSQQTNIERNEQEISLVASKSYVETSAFDTYKEEVSSEFTQRAEQIDMRFTSTAEEISNVDSDLQTKFEKVSKYISFNENGISIGGGPNAITLTLDNDNGIIFSRNDVPFGWWDGTDFYTGNIVVAVNERAQFGDFAFVPRSSGSLSFLKVRGSNSNTGHTHTYKTTTTRAATCTETGIKLHLCSCGESYTESIPSIGHSYTSVVTPPTATAQGYTTYTCKNCGDSYKGDYTETVKPTTATTIVKTNGAEGDDIAYLTSEQNGSSLGTTATFGKNTVHYVHAEADTGRRIETIRREGPEQTIDYVLQELVDQNYLTADHTVLNLPQVFFEAHLGKTFTVTVYFAEADSGSGGGDETTYYTVDVQSNNTDYGTVSGGGSNLESGTTITITATPESGYKFSHWNDGNTNASRTITVTGNATYTAYFEVDTSGGGSDSGTTFKISAVDAVADDFVGIYKADSNGEIDMNTLLGTTAVLTSSSDYGIYLYAKPDGDRKIEYLELLINGNSYGKESAEQYVNSSGIFKEAFGYSSELEGITTYEIRIYFADDNSGGGETTYHTVKTAVSPTGAGSVTGAGTYEQGTTVRFTATPASSNYVFKKWVIRNDNTGATSESTNTTLDFPVFYNMTVTAVFEDTSSGGTGGSGNGMTFKVSSVGAIGNDDCWIYGSTDNEEVDFSNPLGTEVTLFPDSADVIAYAWPGPGRKIVSVETLIDGHSYTVQTLNQTTEHIEWGVYSNRFSTYEVRYTFDYV